MELHKVEIDTIEDEKVPEGQIITTAQINNVDYSIQETSRNTSSDSDSGGSNSSNNNNNNNNNNQGGGNTTDTRKIINIHSTGIVKAMNINYAVVSFADDATDSINYKYRLSGVETNLITPVNADATVIKIELPDNSNRTLEIISSSNTVLKIVSLDEIGSSTVVSQVINDNIEIGQLTPSFIMTTEVLPLSTYLNFVRNGETGSLYTKEVSTTVAKETSSLFSIDAITSPTVSTPPEFDDITEDNASIIIDFNMIVNHLIAQNISISDNNTTNLVTKFNTLSIDNAKLFNEDGSLFILYTDFNTALNNAYDNSITTSFEEIASEATVSDYPIYVKHLMEKGIFATKINYQTKQPDSQTAPSLTMNKFLKNTDLKITMSEENETWYRYLTEIGVPFGIKTYHYLSEARKNDLTITLKKQSFGATTYVDEYIATIKSFGFDDVPVDFEIADGASPVIKTWNSAFSLILKGEYSYYLAYLDQVTILVNGEIVEVEKSGLFSALIKSKYFAEGTNTITIKVKGYMDSTFEVETPVGFIQVLG